jgi:diaminopimelate decarboxylase
MKNTPDTYKINKQKHIEIGGCDTINLAKEFGTPLFVLDEKTIRNRCQTYLKSFRKYYPNTDVIYASKALCTAGVLKLVTSEGLGLDVSSGGELYTALKSGCDLKKIYFHGNNKPKKELKEALDARVGRIVVDNIDELNRLDEATSETGKRAEILVRVNPGIEAHTHEYIKTGTIDSKFGVPFAQLESFIKEVKKKKLISLVGLHAHIGSQILDPKPFADEVKFLLDLTLKYKTRELNIGGGLAIAYLPKDESPVLESFAKEIASVLKDKTDVKLILEPGRSIIGTAGVTLYTIGGRKDIAGIRKYIFIDGGMSDNPRPILYQAVYDAKIANKADLPAKEKVTVAGRFCESGDILIRDIELPEAKAGDILAVFCTGAYNYSMASNYNRVGRPAMVLVNGGDATLILNRESYEDLVRNDAVI